MYNIFGLVTIAIKSSLIRLSVVWVLILSTILIIDISIYIVANTSNPNMDWVGLSAFVISISGLIGAAFYGKVQQKKIETRNIDETEFIEHTSQQNFPDDIPVRNNPVSGKNLLKG